MSSPLSSKRDALKILPLQKYSVEHLTRHVDQTRLQALALQKSKSSLESHLRIKRSQSHKRVRVRKSAAGQPRGDERRHSLDVKQLLKPTQTHTPTFTPLEIWQKQGDGKILFLIHFITQDPQGSCPYACSGTINKAETGKRDSVTSTLTLPSTRGSFNVLHRSRINILLIQEA